MLKTNKFPLALLAVAACAVLWLNGCSSSDSSFDIPDINATHGSKDSDGATYGSGPDNTKPYPQSEEVNLNDVPGVTPKYEPLSRGGNKNYTVLGKNYRVWRDCDSYLEIGTASWYGPGFHGNKTSNGEVYNQKGYSAAHKNLPLPSYLKVTNLENGKAVVVRVNDRGPFHGTRIIDLSEGAAKAIDMTGKGTAKVKLEYIDVRQGNVIANLAHTVASGQNASRDSLRELIESLKIGSPASASNAVKAAAAAAVVSSGKSAFDDYQQYRQSQALESASQDQYQYSAPAAIPGETAYIQIFTSNSQDRAASVQRALDNSTSYPVLVVAEEGLYRVRIGPVAEADVNRVLMQMKTLGYPDSFVKR